ncbi:MAG: flagellar hook-associated protein FlgL [Pirellulales bacterium]|nr:flagellar hook-associated protein FlgL [Pirellulales bacterium]
MTSIVGIPTTRVSDIFIRDRLLRQVQYDQGELFKTQMQLATGRRFELPSEDPVASLRIMDLQRLMERRTQVFSNVQTNGSYLSATDSTLTSVSGLLAEARGAALSVLGTTATDDQRDAVAQQIDQILSQMLDTGNQNFRGRYLFTGSRTEVRPFEKTKAGYIQYLGNQKAIQSYSDIDQLFDTNMNGNQVFGAVSEAVEGTVDVDPVLTYDTRLVDLRGGLGISPGSIKISNGTHFSIVDISGAETIGDLAALIKNNAPLGSQLQVEVTPENIRLRLTSGDLSITEVAGGTTANELGILAETGVGTSWIEGRDLDPILRKTTLLSDAFGVRARAVLHSTNNDNDLLFEADQMGTLYNNVTISFADTAVGKGFETVTWNGVDALTVGIKAGASDANDVITAVMAEYAAGNVPFTVRLDPLDGPDSGAGLVEVTSAVTDYGVGREFDQASGLQITNGDQTYTISLNTAQRFEDVINIINGTGAGVLAEINEAKTGVNIRSVLSGTDFAIGENGGATASDLGLRTLTTSSMLDDFNFGLGVHAFEGGADFTITRTDGVELPISVFGAETVQEVLNLINNDPNNADHLLTARLATYGNGIELVDESGGTGRLTITRNTMSTAAYDLGLIPTGDEESESQVQETTASLDLPLGGAGANNAMIVTARYPGSYGNVQVIFQDAGAGPEAVNYDDVNHTLTFDIIPGTTTANGIIGLVQGDPAANAAFAIQLDMATDPGNTGDGFVPLVDESMTGGGPDVFTGIDTNPRETEGVFTALLRLRNAIQTNNVLQMQRAIDLLDVADKNMTFAHAELGAREQALEVTTERLDEEDVELQGNLSLEWDVDMVEVVSRMTAQQAAFEASLRSMASIFQMTLLNYL